MRPNPQMQLQCDYFNAYACRSCSLLDRSLEDIAQLKYASLVELLLKECTLKPEQIDRLVSPKQFFPSRAKAKLSVSGSVANPIIGLIDENFAGKELLNCPLHLPVLNEIANFIHASIPSSGLTPYDIQTRKGELKSSILTCDARQTGVIVRFVLRSQLLLPKIKQLLPELLAKFPTVRVVSVNTQPLPAAILEGPEEIVLTEGTFIEERFNEVRLCYGPQSFIQVTPEIAERLYHFVANETFKRKPKVLGDIYCGVGGFSLTAAPHAERVYAMELSSEAIANAERGAKFNGISNVQFQAGDAKDFFSCFPDISFSQLIINPPRRGLPVELIDAILRQRIETLIYSSCNPETLIRDMNLFAQRYDCSSITPFDMFPLTKHLEVVAVLGCSK